ncbi:hypothetical protein FBU31_004555 [Coemansia sp. 'formosensis']|nr:hypothetical protein FBU31_004555 [Coemansia sp. 'formosensis']
MSFSGLFFVLFLVLFALFEGPPAAAATGYFEPAPRGFGYTGPTLTQMPTPTPTAPAASARDTGTEEFQVCYWGLLQTFGGLVLALVLLVAVAPAAPFEPAAPAATFEPAALAVTVAPVALASPAVTVAPVAPFEPAAPTVTVAPIAPASPAAPSLAVPVAPFVTLRAPDALAIQSAIFASINTIQCAMDLELEVRNARDAVDQAEFKKAMDEADWAMLWLELAAVGEVDVARHAARKVMTRPNANVNLVEQVVDNAIETFDRIETLHYYSRNPIVSMDFFSSAAKLAQKRARRNVATWEALAKWQAAHAAPTTAWLKRSRGDLKRVAFS